MSSLNKIKSGDNQYALAIVIPVYNEEGCIVEVIRSWKQMVLSLNIRFQICIFNDGSTDQTLHVLKIFENDADIEIINKKNRGHGPTILEGYHRAVQVADWVFQCDSDNEISPEYFPDLWNKRDDFEALFGIRIQRAQNVGRKIISLFSRLTVRILFGSGVTDVNVPYRLMRSKILKNIIQKIPKDTFAPNVIISGVFSQERLRIYEAPVIHKNRQTGEPSLIKWNLVISAIKSFFQTIRCRPSITI